MDSTKLDQAEELLRQHRPSDFSLSGSFAAPESIEAVRFVEDNDLWKARYGSIDEFYAAHEVQHPEIRVYGDVRREIANSEPLSSGGSIAELIARRRQT